MLGSAPDWNEIARLTRILNWWVLPKAGLRASRLALIATDA